MQHAALYIFTLLSFGVLDAIWLTTTASTLYKPTLGDILLATPKIAPLVAFYLTYPVALVIFAGAPAVKAGSAMPALIYGGLFGAFAYATYDLTNFATLRNWTLQLTVIDVLWGTFASGLASVIGYVVAVRLTAWFG
jgi:uncharacterized membrane protein